MTSILELPHGIHRAVPHDVYHQKHLGLVSKTALDLVSHSLARYRSWIDGDYGDGDSSPALDFGSAFHCAALERDRFGMEYLVQPKFGDMRTNAAKERRAKWEADNPGHESKKMISAEDDDRIRGMLDALSVHPLAQKLLRDGEPEVTVRWKDAETGLECKTRADYLVRKLRMVVDLKTTDDASYEAFRRSVAKYRYHVTDALYRRGFGAVDAPVQHYVFLVIEKAYPHDIATYALDAESIGRGHAAVSREMQALAEAVRVDEWPGLPVGIQEIAVPPWAA